MILFDGTEPKEKNKIFYSECENRIGMMFIDCNIKTISSGFSELVDAIMGYARKTDKIKKDFLGNVITVFKRLTDIINLTMDKWESPNNISIGIVCVFESKDNERIIYSIVAPPFFPIERIEQII